jgi:hypothetical protein
MIEKFRETCKSTNSNPSLRARARIAYNTLPFNGGNRPAAEVVREGLDVTRALLAPVE